MKNKPRTKTDLQRLFADRLIVRPGKQIMVDPTTCLRSRREVAAAHQSETDRVSR